MSGQTEQTDWKTTTAYEVLMEAADPLVSWYAGAKRRLPWRGQPAAYHVWVSEIMLQQTRVEAVKPYYARFLCALPDIGALAAVEEPKLLKLWEGLGYYNRVRNMQKAAQIMVRDYGGKMPETYDEILALPGIGTYTAGAVCSIAYGMPVPAVDGNVLRVISRVLAKDWDIAMPQVKRQVEELLGEVMRRKMKEQPQNSRESKQFPGSFNQALMELGATVCVPNGIARCDICPLNGLCAARKENRILELPYKSAKKPRRVEEKTVFVLQGQTSIVLRRRPAKGLLAGLYEFPNTEGFLNAAQALSYINALGFSAVRIRPLPDAKHIFTHVEWHMKAYLVQLDETLPNPGKPWIYAEKHEVLKTYAIPSAFAAYRSEQLLSW